MNQLRVAKLLLDYFDELGVVAVLGGSMASSLIGEPRATNDIDLAAALNHDTAERLIGKLGEAFYADPWAIEEAVTHRSSICSRRISAWRPRTSIPATSTVFTIAMRWSTRRRSARVLASRSQIADGPDLDEWTTLRPGRSGQIALITRNDDLPALSGNDDYARVDDVRR